MRRIHQPSHHRQGRRRGAAAVETAVVLPIALTLIFGIMQVGYALMIQQALQDAARRGCRAGTLPNRTNTAVTSTVNGQLQTEGINVNNTTTTILVNNVAGNVAQAQTGDAVCVTVSMPLSSVVLFPNYFSGWTGTLNTAVTLRCE